MGNKKKHVLVVDASWETKTKRCEHMAHGRGRGVNFWPGVHSLFPASAVQMSIVIIATARHFDDVCQGRGAHIARRQSECQFVIVALTHVVWRERRFKQRECWRTSN
jgi:hypothetical protein